MPQRAVWVAVQASMAPSTLSLLPPPLSPHRISARDVGEPPTTRTRRTIRTMRTMNNALGQHAIVWTLRSEFDYSSRARLPGLRSLSGVPGYPAAPGSPWPSILLGLRWPRQLPETLHRVGAVCMLGTLGGADYILEQSNQVTREGSYKGHGPNADLSLHLPPPPSQLTTHRRTNNPPFP